MLRALTKVNFDDIRLVVQLGRVVQFVQEKKMATPLMLNWITWTVAWVWVTYRLSTRMSAQMIHRWPATLSVVGYATNGLAHLFLLAYMAFVGEGDLSFTGQS